jgi:membrane glycosyltransferase
MKTLSYPQTRVMKRIEIRSIMSRIEKTYLLAMGVAVKSLADMMMKKKQSPVILSLLLAQMVSKITLNRRLITSSQRRSKIIST